MDETNRNSAKLDIEAARLQSAAADKDKQEHDTKESYKKLSESELEQPSATAAPSEGQVPVAAIPDGDGSTMVRENGNCKEGEDERMLNGGGGDAEKEKLTQKEVEVKFVPEKNGDARIDMELDVQQTFSGMTKEELMKFANDPFWVRLRWLLFALFWGLWVAMLLGAVYIIMDAPKCAAPVPLTWYQEGPLVIVDERNYKTHVDTLQQFGAKGVIYELPADETYLVDTPSVENKIKELVGTFNAKDIKVILDLTPNFVTKDDQLFKDALEGADPSSRSAFVWKQTGSAPTNWLALEGGSAWKEVTPQHFVLAQFGPGRFDLQLNDPLAKEKLKSTLRHLVQLGVRGFRLTNAKHFIVDRDGKDDVNAEVDDKSLEHTHYGFWTHSHTTYQDGLGALLQELVSDVRNATEGDGFLSVSDDITRPEVFTVNENSLGMDLPLYGDLDRVMRQPTEADSAKVIRDDIAKTYSEIKHYNSPTGGKTWIQWSYNKDSLANVDASEYNTFMFLLPGVPVVPLDVLSYGNASHSVIKHLEQFRATPSYQHGTFGISTDANGTSVGYTRQKSGNPGYFVALNLADQAVEADFSSVEGIAEELTVVLTSENYQVADIATKSKIPSKAVPLSARSALVTTYVPK